MRVRRKEFNYTIITPLCNTYSRSLHSGRPRPRPLRDEDPPNDIPACYRNSLSRIRASDETICRTIERMEICHVAATKIFTEFPEDLGARVVHGKKGTPASLWRNASWMKALDQCGASSAAHHACQWGCPVLKPDRTASNIANHNAIGFCRVAVVRRRRILHRSALEILRAQAPAKGRKIG